MGKKEDKINQGKENNASSKKKMRISLTVKKGGSAGKKVVELMKKRDELEGTKLHFRVKNFSFSLYTQVKNYRELLECFEYYEKNHLEILDQGKKRKFFDFMCEFTRCFHNYVASTSSVIDHTRVFLKTLKNSQLEQEYEIELQKLKSTGRPSFINCLRQYSLHKRVLSFNALFSYAVESEEKTVKIILKKKPFVDWKSLKQPAKKYLEKYEDDIDLKKTVEEYQQSIGKFQSWFLTRVEKLYEPQIREALKVEAEIARLIKKIDGR